jgi:DNA-binding CsgD family transcriptional regulator/PAS domain-containing protein
MEHPSALQLRGALDVVLELGELEQLEEYPSRVATLLGRLIGCEISSYTAVDPSSGRTTVAAAPAESLIAADVEVFGRYALQNPLIEHYARTGDGRALRISDFVTRRRLHATDLYDHVYRHTETEYQMAVTLPSMNARRGSQEMIGLTVSRAKRDFTPRERALADLLRPHLRATLERLHERAMFRAIGSEWENHSAWAVLADRDGTIALCTTAAERDLGFRAGDRLPGGLHQWASQERARHRDRPPGSATAATNLEIAGRELSVQLRVSAHEQLDALHLAPIPASPRPKDLLVLGLTRRQSEVLALALEGRTSPQIAATMTLSTRTIEKHFEAIYARLGVSGRSQAILRTLELI